MNTDRHPADADGMGSSVEQLVRNHYEALSPSERRLADVIVQRGKDLASYSATELSQLAGVSKATAARFFKRLGYEDFSKFRADVRARVSAESPLFHLDRATKAAGNHRGLASHFEADANNLAETFERVGPKELQRAVAVLRAARKIWVVGYRNGFATAFYAHALFSHAIADVTLVNEAAGKVADTLSEIARGDVLFAVDFRRRTRLLPRVVEVAREAGAEVVLLTYSPLSQVAARSSVVLHCATKGTSIFDSYVAAMSLVNYLGTELVTTAPRKARERMERMERIHELLGDLAE
ncbi:MurR/RpiR family transcriptional regulator [Ramlibacter sp.]|uniref:MurR/RpiR family transcriptional regulator n=1 Tax=Ramlibacter sp. TaxID=1917967 RepID=UPI002FC80CFF